MGKLTIALIGANGLLAKPIASALTSAEFKTHFEYPIRVLTRDPSNVKETLPDTKLYAAKDESSYESALKGVDVVLDLRPPQGLGDLSPVHAAKKAGVTAYAGSDYGYDYEDVGKYAPAFGVKQKLIDAVKEAGLQPLQFHVGYFLEGVLGAVPNLTFVQTAEGISDYPDEDVRLSLTSIRDIGLGVAGALSRPLASLPPVIRFSGQTLTAAKIVEIYEKHSGKKFEHKPKSREEIAKTGYDHLENGTVAEGFLDILRAISVDAPGGFFFDKNDAEFVNPGQELFQWTTIEESAAQILGH